MIEATLTFFVNGASLGPAFVDDRFMEEPIFGVISVCNPGDSI